MMTTSPSSQRVTTDAAQDDPLREIRRRLVQVYTSMAEATNDDPGIRTWSMGQIREVLDYIKSVEVAQRDA